MAMCHRQKSLCRWASVLSDVAPVGAHYYFVIQNCKSRLSSVVPGIEYQALIIKLQVSSVERRASNFKFQASTIDHQALNNQTLHTVSSTRIPPINHHLPRMQKQLPSQQYFRGIFTAPQIPTHITSHHPAIGAGSDGTSSTVDPHLKSSCWTPTLEGETTGSRTRCGNGRSSGFAPAYPRPKAAS